MFQEIETKMRKLLASGWIWILILGVSPLRANDNQKIQLELVKELAIDSVGIKWSPQGNYFFTSSYQDEINYVTALKVYSYHDLSLVNTLETEMMAGDIVDIQWSPDGNKIGIADYYAAQVKFMDIYSSSSEVAPLADLQGNLLDFEWSSSNIISIVLQTGPDQTHIVHYDMAPGENPTLLHSTYINSSNKDNKFQAIVWNPNGNLFATVSSFGDISVWSVENFEEVILLPSNSNILDYVTTDTVKPVWTHDSNSIIGISRSFSEGYKIWQWYLDEEVKPPFSDFLHTPAQFEVSYDDQYFLFREMFGDILIGTVETKEIILNLSETLSNAEIAVSWHPTENILAVNDGETLTFYKIIQVDS